MNSYDKLRQGYRPEHIKVLLIAESPPPEAEVESSRHFYRSDSARSNDRLFVNTLKALYPEAANMSAADLEKEKDKWLRQFQADGWYMIEALETSLPHGVSKPERQELIRRSLPRLVKRVKALVEPATKLILIKSNVFEVAAEPLRQAGFTMLNKELVDYPGQYNQKMYRQKLAELAGRDALGSVK